MNARIVVFAFYQNPGISQTNTNGMSTIMKKSKALTLALVGSALLVNAGCGGSHSRTLYDKAGNAVARSNWKNPDGSWRELYDENGNPVPQTDVQKAYSDTTSHSTSTHRTYHSSGWFFGPSWGGGGYSSGSRGSPSVSGGSVSRGGFGSTGGSSSSGG